MGNIDTALFLSEAQEVLGFFPKLKLSESNGLPVLVGKLDLISDQGVIEDTYTIEIHPTEGYPFRFPLVYETGGRIPKNIDWHIFETDGHCCIKTIPEEILTCKEGITLTLFIRVEVVPYFFNQTFRRKRGYYLNERPHGDVGEIEFFKEVLDTNDILKVPKWLYFISKRNEPTRTEKKCFCGSGRMYRHCHRLAYRKLSSFSNNELLFFAKRITNSLEFKATHLIRNL